MSLTELVPDICEELTVFSMLAWQADQMIAERLFLGSNDCGELHRVG